MIKRASLQHIHDNDQRVGLRHPTLADKEGSSLSIRPGEALHAIVMAAIDLLLRTGKLHQLELSSSRCRGLRHAHARLFDLCEDVVKLWLPHRRVHDDLLGLPGDLFNLEACNATSARCSSRVVWHGSPPTLHLGQDALHGPRAAAARHGDVERVCVLCLRVSSEPAHGLAGLTADMVEGGVGAEEVRRGRARRF